MSAAAEQQQTETRLETDNPARWQLHGNLDFATVPSLLAQIEQKITDAPGRLEVNLEGIRHSDSAGMALLMEWTRLARRRNIEVHFLHAPAQLRELARLTGLSELLGMAP